jgi:hypothetical protein
MAQGGHTVPVAHNTGLVQQQHAPVAGQVKLAT